MLILLSLLLVPTLIVAWFGYGYSIGSIRAERMKDVGRIADARHEELKMVFNRAIGRSNAFLADMLNRCGKASIDPDCAEEALRAFVHSEDALGALIRRPGGYDLAAGDVSFRADGMKFRPGQLAQFSKWAAGAERTYFILAEDIHAGVQLAVSYPIGIIQPVFVSHPDLGNSGETFLADGEGFFITRARYPAEQGHSHPISAVPMLRCLTPESAETLDLDYRDVPIIHGFRFVPEIGGGCIMAHVDQAEAFAPLAALKRQFAAAALIFSLLAVLTARLLARWMVRPITRLTDVVRDIAAGNLAVRAVPEGGNEMARLAASFNAMTDQLESIHAELEQRVEARTRELQAKDAQLREALSMNRNILMTSAVGVAAYRQDGQCVMANPAFGDTVGGTEGQMLSQNFRQMRSWQESGLLESAESVLANGLKAEREVELTTTFGRHLWLHCRLSRFISQGEPHLLLMIHDITVEKQAKEALSEREREFRTLAENVPDNIIRCDREGRVLYLNPALERTLGCCAGDMAGKNAGDDPEGRYFELAQAMRRVAATGVPGDFEQVVPGPDGEPHYHAIRIVAERGPDGAPVGALAVGRDITQQRTTEEALRLAASVFHSSSEGVLVTDADGTILSVNPAFIEITGYSEAEALGLKPSLLRSDRHGPDFYRAMWDTLTTEGHWQGEIWNRRKGGEAYLEWLTINRIDDFAGNAVRYVSVFHDITELRRKDERIRHLAFHDALTGLPNRALMQDRLRHALERAKREGARLSVTFIDLDHFKAVNDGLGHDVGDMLLQEVAQRIRSRAREMDTVARIGGDEFVVLMEELDKAGDCVCLAQALIDEISRPMELRGHVVQVGATMGMAFFPEDGGDSLELMKCADMAMYAAKAAGRNTYRFFRQEMLDQTSQRLAMGADLRRAIARRELELHYQPKVALRSTGKPLGVEALVRWRHPVRGLLPPSEFIFLAEETGLIIDLGEWVLDEVCRQAAEWQSHGLETKIAINVSAKELDEGDLAERIAALTASHGISPSVLEIELTESAVMANPENAAGLFARLRRMGVTVAVDDFGTGYSSLAYLRCLPIDVLKIDRTFVMDADRNEEDAQIVKTIVALGQMLKLTVVAEGIETTGQAELLTSFGCDSAQGFLFSRPLPAREVEEWLVGQK